MFQPVGQKRHTNIAIVSFRKKVEGKEYKFEIACYPNKVLNQREGIETDMDQVLQTETVFTNVSRGEIATNEDLITVFETTNHLKVCKQIIKEGHLQVSDKEREYIAESKSRDVLNMVAQMTMDATTGYPLTVTQIQAALDDIHFRITSKSSLRGSKSVKQRDEEEETKVIARECVKKLEAGLPHRISRVNMILRLVSENIELNEIEELAERKCIIQRETPGSYLITCHPSFMKRIKDGFQDRVRSLTVVDSFVHKILPNVIPPQPVHEVETETPRPQSIVTQEPKPKNKTGLSCATCGETPFESATDFRVHCKSEWHSFNKKRQVKGLPFIDHLEFEMMPQELRDSFNAVDP
jgi:ribosome maturation protein SDO1